MTAISRRGLFGLGAVIAGAGAGSAAAAKARASLTVNEIRQHCVEITRSLQAGDAQRTYNYLMSRSVEWPGIDQLRARLPSDYAAR